MGATMIFLREFSLEISVLEFRLVCPQREMFGGNKTRNLNSYALLDSCGPNYFGLLLAFSY